MTESTYKENGVFLSQKRDMGIIMKKAKERAKSFILWFDEIGIEDISLVGGKNASLGEMCKNTNVKIPQGFAITAYAYKYILEKAGVLNDLKAVLHGVNIHDSQALAASAPLAVGAEASVRRKSKKRHVIFLLP